MRHVRRPQATARRLSARSRCGGFTLVELLVVMTIIAILMSMSILVIANYISRAREQATAATILKIDGLIKDRMDALGRALETDPDVQETIDEIQADLIATNLYYKTISRDMLSVLVRKEIVRRNFPQRPTEVPGWSDDTLPLGHPLKGKTDISSSELLYYALTNSTVFGVPPVGAGEFEASEAQDLDGDGLLEFIDAWGNPLRFYRWPTGLIKPNGTDLSDLINYNPAANINLGAGASILIQGLPAPATVPGERNPLAEDPDDPLGRIVSEIKRLEGSSIDIRGEVNATNWHDFDTFHTPLVVSAGRDGEFGLRPPPLGSTISAGDRDHLAVPFTTAEDPQVESHLSDNITNRNRRAGGN